jgi:hypothetical protein
MLRAWQHVTKLFWEITGHRRYGTEIDTLVKSGKVPAANVTVLARSGIVVVVHKGAVNPDISSPGALKRTLLAARSISYVNPASAGASGMPMATLTSACISGRK